MMSPDVVIATPRAGVEKVLNKILGGDSNDSILTNSKLSEDYLVSVSMPVAASFAQQGSTATTAFLIV